MKHLSPSPKEPSIDGAAALLLEQARRIVPVASLVVYKHLPNRSPGIAARAGRTSPEDRKGMVSAAKSAIRKAEPTVENGITACPVMLDDDIWGAVAYKRESAESDGSASVLSNLSQIVIENHLLKERIAQKDADEHRRMERLATVYDIGQAFHSMRADELLNLICSRATSVMQAHACSLLLRNQNNTLTIKASFGLPPNIVQKTNIPRGTGIAWHVASTGKAVLLNESPSEQIGDVSIHSRSDISSSMCVPLRSHDNRILGVLSIRRMVPAPHFTEEDLQLFSLFAHQAARAISTAELIASLNRRIHEMATVNRLTTAINSTLDLEYVLAQIADCIIDVVGFDRCIVYLVDHKDQVLESRIVRGYLDADLYTRTMDPNDGVVGLAVREQIVIFAEGEQLATASPVNKPETAGANAVVAAPIVVRKNTIGVIVADNQNSGRPVDNQQVELLSTFVNHAGLAIENSRLYEAMEQKYSELNVLYEMSRTIGSAYGVDNASELLLEVAGKAVRCQSAAFALIDGERGKLSLRTTRSADSRPVDWQMVESDEISRLLLELREPKVLFHSHGTSRNDPWTRRFDKLLGSGRSMLIMPLLSDTKPIGVLLMIKSGTTGFESNEIKLLSIIGSHASVVINNAAAYERNVQEKVLELSALYDLSQRISTASNLTEALDSILAIVTDLVECDECLIWTTNPDNDDIELRSSRWVGRSEESDRSRPQVDQTLAKWAIYERKAVVVPDIRQDTRFSLASVKNSRVRSLMSIPLVVQDEVVGVLSVHSYNPNAFTGEQLRVLSVVASQAASIYRGLEALTALTSYTDNILTSIAAGVITVDTDGVIVSWNRAAEEILQFPARKAYGQNLYSLMESVAARDTDRQKLLDAAKRVLGTGVSEHGLEINLAFRDEQVVHLMLTLSQLKNQENEPLGLVIILEDVTNQIHMQEEMRRMGELAAIGQLAASIAHELRNPLSSIKGAAQFLGTETTDESTREFLNIIVEEVDGLNKIASEFLDFARPLKIEASEVNLHDLVQRQASLLAGQLQAAGISLECECCDSTPAILADQKQLEQVLLNLFLNSIQAMPDGGRIHVSIQPSQRWQNCVEVQIRDTGVGIPADRLGKIFTPFFTTKIKGTGLGLPVVQKIVQNHQGHIEVDSKEGEGATFRINLPVQGPVPSLLGDAEVAQPDLLERSSGD